MKIKFEKMNEKHRKEVINILNYYIDASTSAYREQTVDEDFVFHLLEGADVTCSYIIRLDTDEIIGFCSLEPYMNISTFSAVAEVMHFIHHEFTGRGIGSLALKKIEEEARKKGIKSLLADISDENHGSISFHKRNGFMEYGRLPNIGKKFDRSFGIVYLLKEL